MPDRELEDVAVSVVVVVGVALSEAVVLGVEEAEIVVLPVRVLVDVPVFVVDFVGVAVRVLVDVPVFVVDFVGVAVRVLVDVPVLVVEALAHAVAPALEEVPAGQARHAVLLVAPVLALYVPAAQAFCVALVDPLPHQCPAEHCPEQAEDVPPPRP